MDRFLATLNKLQDVFTTSGVDSKDIDLPQIVVVGSQSAGKSSVLESIAKQDFLPRGMGIVTRRPLVLQMIQETAELEVDGVMRDTWVQFLHTGDEKVFTDMKEVQEEIVADTARVCGGDKVISGKPIHVKLHSTKIPSLTLVDLPGLTKIAVGDQPKNIDKLIEKLVRSFIQKENSIILAVSPGNMDIANSDSLKLAREVDPDGLRTLGVITKCDLMEENKESRKLLSGETLAMELGLVGVINRNNKMLSDGLPLEVALQAEDEFFEKRYPELADKMGTVQLGRQLCDVLTSHLKKCLPAVSAKISELQEKHRTVLQDLGMETADPRQCLLALVSKFAESINKSMEGQVTFSEAADTPGSRTSALSNNISAGAELFKTLNTDCIQRLSLIAADQGLGDLKEEVQNTGGIQPALYVPDSVFTRLIKKQLSLLRNPSMSAIEKCHTCIGKSFERLAETTLGEYPRLMAEVVQICREHLVEQMKKTKDFTEDYLSNELSYINTNHPEFVERYEVAADMFRVGVTDSKKKDEPTESNMKYMASEDTSTAFGKLMSRYRQGESLAAKVRADNEAELVLKLIIHYFCISRGQLIDVLTKSVIRYMVHDVSKGIGALLLKNLYTTEDNMAGLVMEAESTQRQRKSSSRMLGALKQAENLVLDISIGKE